MHGRLKDFRYERFRLGKSAQKFAVNELCYFVKVNLILDETSCRLANPHQFLQQQNSR